jgi:hypothetical protein
MKYITIILFITILFNSCAKEFSHEFPENTEGVFDDFVENEIVEYVDSTIDESEIYQTEAENKVDQILPVGGTVSDLVTPENYCSGFRYGSYFVPRQENKVLLLYSGDNIRSITTSDGVIKNLRKDPRNNKAFYFTLDSLTRNLQKVNFVFHLNADNAEKSVRFLEKDSIKGFYGTSQWGRMTERQALNLPLQTTLPRTLITAAYVPKLGDVLYFGDREGVITKEYPKNKQGKFKFKVTEWNAKCTGRKMTSSRLLFDLTKIVSGNKLDTFTHYSR